MNVDIKVKGRKSIHKDESVGSANTTAEIHGSTEQLFEETSYEADDSLLSNTSYEERESIINSPNFSPTPRRNTRRRNISTPTIRNESPIRIKAPRNDSRNVGAKASAKKSDSFTYFCGITVSIVLVVLFTFWSFIGLLKDTPDIPPSTVRSCTYSDLRRQYPDESEYLWRNLKSGIEDMLNNRTDSPGVYLFIHNGRNIATQLIKDIANASSSCFGSSMKPVEIDSEDFTSEDAVDDYGFVIEKYKEKIKEGNVILIANLNEIPPQAARALHSICDTVTPIVRRVMIFLSLVADHREGRVIDTAVDSLLGLWENKIDSNELDPLITRVTDQVILLQSS